MANKFHCTDDSLMPRRATPGSAGYDFFAPTDFVVPAHGTSTIVDSGVSVELNPSCVLLMYVRSSYGFKHNTRLINGTGIIDSDYYPNRIMCILKNDSDEDLVVHKGDKYMQGIFMDYYRADNEIPPTSERQGGLGSTGK